MRILVIDDERTFSRIEHSLAWNDEIVYARNLLDAYHQVMENHWTRVYLDHDLGSRSDGSPAEVTDITEDIEELAFVRGRLLDVDEFIIHSMNPLGRKEMYEALHKFYNVSFARVQDLV